MYQMCTKGTGDVFPQNRCAEVTPKKTGHTSTLGEASELSPKPLPQMSPRETWPSGKLHFGDLWCSTCPFCGELIYISCAHTHTLPLPHHLYKDPCFLASSLLNPDFVYIVVNTDFSGFWFPFFPSPALACSFGFASNLLGRCLQNSLCPVCSAFVLPALWHSSPSACFSG